MILEGVKEAVDSGGKLSRSCKAIGLSSRTIQRWRKLPDGGVDQRQGPKTQPKNQLIPKEREKVLKIVNSPEYRNQSVNQVVPALADLGIYVASESTMYRILRKEKLDAHRSASKPPLHSKPREHVATGPNQVWSWDITYLRSPVAGLFFYLYMIVDVWSRKIIDFEVREMESSDYAAYLVNSACQKEGIRKNALVLHQDNGSPMKGATLKVALERLGVLPSYSRPRVSDDNPFSESLFRTMKYRPEYPTKPFESLKAAKKWVEGFAEWYNFAHRHSAIRYVTPAQRHNGEEKKLLSDRRKVYAAARKLHPERWAGATRNWNQVEKVYLNPEDPCQGVTRRQEARNKVAS